MTMNCEDIRTALINIQELITSIGNEIWRSNVRSDEREIALKMIDHAETSIGVAIENIIPQDSFSPVNEHIFDLPVYEQDSSDEVVRRLQEARTAWLTTQ